MIHIIKNDLIKLFEFIDFKNHNKFWRKIIHNKYVPSYQYDALYKALRIVTISISTIDYLKDLNSFNNTIFEHIYINPNYSESEKFKILNTFKEYIDWYGIYQIGMTFDMKVKYYKEIRHSFIYKRYGSYDEANKMFKEIERDYKINLLIE